MALGFSKKKEDEMAKMTPVSENKAYHELEKAQLQASLTDARATALENKVRSFRAQIDLLKVQRELAATRKG